MADAKEYLTTPVFRISFPHLFVAYKSDDAAADAKAKYSCSAIWTLADFTPREKELWKLIMLGLDAEAQKAFKSPWKNLPDTIKRGVRDGGAKAHLGGYGEGTRFANLNTNIRPGVIDADGETEIKPENGNTDLIYPGCYCRATVNVFSYSNKGRGIALGLQNVQRIKDGERLDNRRNAKDDFKEPIDSAWLDQDETNDLDDDFN